MLVSRKLPGAHAQHTSPCTGWKVQIAEPLTSLPAAIGLESSPEEFRIRRKLFGGQAGRWGRGCGPCQHPDLSPAIPSVVRA